MTSWIEPNTSKYAAVPTLPLSGGKLKTVIATFLINLGLRRRVAHFKARWATISTRSWRAIAFPVAPSLPDRIIGSIAPSNSGIAICKAT